LLFRIGVGVALASGLSGCVRSPSERMARPVSPEVAAATITATTLAAPIRFLADDELEGRAPGTRGDRLARQYIISMMAGTGLEPGGPGGQWEQPFALVGVRTIAPRRWVFSQQRRQFDLQPAEFVAVGGRFQPEVGVTGGEVIFVGYGMQAPEYQWDDFKGVDVRGKVLLMLNNDPDWDPALFAGRRRLYYGRWTYKYESAARQGAAGAIIIHTDESAGYPWHTVQTSWSGENSHLPDSDRGAVAIQAWITESAASRLVAFAGQDLAALIAAARERAFMPVPLGVTTSLTLRNELRHYQTANVLGLLAGRDPVHRDEVVIVTAHHDHLGTTTRDGEQVVYNGAVDNAAGIAQLLALARACRALSEPPRRSILFVSVGAEEQGLLGSAYYAAHPTFPVARIMANLNFDGGNIWGRTRDIAGVGFGKSTLDAYVRAAAGAQHRIYVDEAFPERGAFYRSDQFSFAKIGVPALFLRPGIDFIGRPEGWGKEQTEAWIAHHYHQPSDDFDPSWNLDGMVEDTRLAFAVVRMVTETTDVPAWVPGDEFAAVREKSRQSAAGSRQ
jgi:Zn-dependent M28 family amino/carboxypeptidase